jgi:hypothetical protein
MAFIPVQQSLITHRKTLRLARLLNFDRYAVVGRLVALWTWCLDNAPDGRLGVLGDDVDPDILAEVMGWSAEIEGRPDELMDTLILVGFLDVDEGDQSLHIHDWHEWRAHSDCAPDDASDDNRALTPVQVHVASTRTQKGGAV